MRNRFPFIAYLLILFAVILTGCGALSEDVTPPPGYQPPVQQSTPTAESAVFPMLSPDPAKGAAIYIENCAPCHGDTGLGDGPDAAQLPNPVAPIGSESLARQATPEDWYLMVANGYLERYMPPFKSLSVPERWNVIAYAFSLSMPSEQLELGAELYGENCAQCHGESGRGDGPESDSLADSPIDFTDQAFMGTRSANDLFAAIDSAHKEMPEFSALSEDEHWALTYHLRTLTFDNPTVDNAQAEGTAETKTTEAAVPEEAPASTQEAAETPSLGIGTIGVSVVNPSGGEIPLDADVTLYGYENMQEASSQTMPLPEGGVAFFENIPMSDGLIYLATVDHDQVTYGSGLAQVANDTIETILEIVVYDTTTEVSNLVIDRLHIFFEFTGDGTLQVVELILLSNPSDVTVRAANGDEPAIIFELPEGATNLTAQESMRLRYAPVEGGLGVGSVRPSMEPYEITFAFEMPYDKEKLDLALPIPLDTQAALIIAPEDGVKVRSAQLENTGARDLQGMAFSTYTAESLSAGDTLSFSLSGSPNTGTDWLAGDQTSSSTSLIIGLGAFGLTLVGVGFYIWNRDRYTNDDWDEDDLDDNSDLSAAETQEDLMDAIIALDDLYKAGELPEDAHRKRRAELKARLQEMIER